VNIPLDRLIEGIIATMRSDVIPHIADSYARGQAVGVIDLLNNIAPRVEWAQAPLARLVESKAGLLAEIEALAPGVVSPVACAKPDSADDLLAVKARLDAAIGDAVAVIWPRRDEAGFARAAQLLKTHLHDEMRDEMKKTRKPLFAEIASGTGGDGN
jgi:hypothetical protein